VASTEMVTAFFLLQPWLADSAVQDQAHHGLADGSLERAQASLRFAAYWGLPDPPMPPMQ